MQDHYLYRLTRHMASVTILLVAAPALGVQPQSLSGDIPCGGSVLVEAGDTLAQIAALCGVDEADILRVNRSLSDADQIIAGQRLSIPAAVPAATLSTGELETLLAPIALYPDALLAEILPAATYPLEIVQANRLVSTQDGDIDTDNQDWAPSVSALVRYPEVLTKLSDDLDWTIALGDAFLAQPDDVFATIQSLRAQANNAGNLKTNDHHEIIVEPVTDIEYEDTVVEHRTVIRIVPRYVDRIYVPYYDPYRVYHPWVHHHSYYDPVFSFSIGYGLGSWLSHHLHWGYHHHLRIYPRHYRYPRYYGSYYGYTDRHNWSYWHHRPVHRRGYRYNSQPRVRIEQGQRGLVNVPRTRNNQGRRNHDYRARERFAARSDTRRTPESRLTNRRSNTRATNERDLMLARLRQNGSQDARSEPRSTQTGSQERVRRLTSNSARNRNLVRGDADTVRDGLRRARSSNANRNENRPIGQNRRSSTGSDRIRSGSLQPSDRSREQSSRYESRPRAQTDTRQRREARESRNASSQSRNRARPQESHHEARPRAQRETRQRRETREPRNTSSRPARQTAERSGSRQQERSKAESRSSHRRESGSSRRGRDRR